MRHSRKALLLSGALALFSSFASAEYHSFTYDDLHAATTAPTSKDYWTLKVGSSYSDLESNGAAIEAGYHHQYSEFFPGLGVGAFVSSSLASMVTEGAAPGGEDLDFRYTALTGYVSSQLPLITFADTTKLSLEGRVGGSGTKVSGKAAQLIDDEFDFGVYYGGSVIYSTLYDFQFTLSYDVQDPIDVSAASLGLRVLF